MRLTPERLRLAVRCAALALALTVGLGAPGACVASASDALPRRPVLDVAVAAYKRIQAAGLLHTPLLTIIDYSLPSTEKRLWVLDPQRLRVLFNDYVAHGRGSATEEQPELAVQFGNEPESRRSSLGTFLTGQTYVGMHGYSLELYGLDPGLNDRAFERKIVMHPAPYVGAEYRAVKEGRVGRSWGCPALDPAVAGAIIDRIQDGSVVYVAGPTPPPPPTITPAVVASLAVPPSSAVAAPVAPAVTRVTRVVSKGKTVAKAAKPSGNTHRTVKVARTLTRLARADAPRTSASSIRAKRRYVRRSVRS